MAVHPLRRPSPAPTPRARLEAAIEAAIALLDRLDPDPDLEDSHDQEAVDEREPDHDHVCLEYVSHHDQTQSPAVPDWRA